MVLPLLCAPSFIANAVKLVYELLLRARAFRTFFDVTSDAF
jgi:hypothetical protein